MDTAESSVEAQIIVESQETTLRAQLEAEISRLELALEESKQQISRDRKTFETWAIALEDQVDNNSKVLSGKANQLKAVEEQLEKLHYLVKEKEEQLWTQQKKFEAELAEVETQKRIEIEEIRREGEGSNAESQVERLKTELKAQQSAALFQEEALNLKVSDLTAQIASLQERLQAERTQSEAISEKYKEALATSENARLAAIQEVQNAQGELTAVKNQLNQVQQENVALQHLKKTIAQTEANKAELETELIRVKGELKGTEFILADKKRELESLKHTLSEDSKKSAAEIEHLKQKEEAVRRVAEQMTLFSEECRSHLESNQPRDSMDKYQKDLNDYRAQLAKCQASLTRYEDIIQVGEEKLKSGEMLLQTRDREVEILKKALRAHNIAVPNIPEASGLPPRSLRGSQISHASHKPQVTNEPCASCATF